MSLFLPSIWRVDSEFIHAFDYIHRLSLNIHWRLQGLQWLYFCWRFMDQQWHNIFDNSIRRPWLYFRYRFDASIVNSLMLSIPYSSCLLVFIDDYKVYSDSVFADDLWITSDIAFLTIPFITHYSIFAFDLTRR
jgi:hypothetical protein